MKIKNIIYGLIIVIALGSCSDWLTVYPKTEMPTQSQFSSEQGFKDALSGVYTLIKNPTLYGGGLTFSNIEYMAALWDVNTSTAEQALSLHKYSDEKATLVIDAIYAKQYNAIVNLNAILENIDLNKTVFKTEGMYEIVKGEALALRAFIHFDLLRMFGPLPSLPDGAGGKLPYVKRVSKEINIPITYTEYKTAVLKDLTDAENLLKTVDPLVNATVAANKSSNIVSDYFAYRIIRMNFYAVKALQARANIWFGNNTDAYDAAMAVINAQNPDGTKKFTLGSTADFGSKNFVLPSEHVFCLHDYALYTKYTNNFSSGTLKKGSTITNIKTTMFGNTGTDIRELNLWELITLGNGTSCHIIKKYQVPQTITNINSDYRQIPLIRLSELYMIAIETGTGVQSLWDEYRSTRGITAKTLPADIVALKKDIMIESRKEFYAEGQMFYLYKRYNSPRADILFSSTSMVVNYVVPLPKSEISQ
ncbi:MAG: RagB/SusD family nutrient uptake outer membrane protein [Bacteroidales bacterium]|jgi:hypothetical protein